MNILIISQYFWPENFRINDLALGLKERGHTVSVLTGKPNYPSGSFFEGYGFFTKRKDNFQGIEIIRSPLLARGKSSGIRLFLNYFSFAFFATLKALSLKKKYDRIFVYEPSPITVGIPAVFASRRLKIPMYFWVQDLWPESVATIGQVNNKFVLIGLNKLTKWIYRNSKFVLIQSEGFKQYIVNQGIPAKKIVYFPNSVEKLFRKVSPSEEVLKVVPKVPFSIMFAGNIGESQDFKNIIAAAKIIYERNKNIHFVILGRGRQEEIVRSKIAEYGLEDNFHLLGAFPVEMMPYFFSTADGLLVSLGKSKIFSLTIPSKVQSYLACGKPIVGCLDGEGAKVISDAKCGFVSAAGNPLGLADAIESLYNLDQEERKKMGDHGLEFFNKNFEREKLFSNLESIFKQE